MFIEAKDDGGGGDNWTTGAISRAKLQSKPRKTKIGTEVAHVTHDSDTTFKVNRSTCRGGAILWQPPAQLVMFVYQCQIQLPSDICMLLEVVWAENERNDFYHIRV